MKVNIISDSMVFPLKWGGVHTAFVNHIAMLERKHITVQVNSLQGADITHIHTFGPFGLWKLFSSKPNVITTHVVPDTFVGSWVGGYTLKPLVRKLLVFLYSRATLVIALNEQVRADLIEAGLKNRIEVLPNPIDETLFKKNAEMRTAMREQYCIDEEAFVVLSVGKIITRKGFASFARTAEKLPKITFFWIGGYDFKLISKQSQEDKYYLKNLPKNLIIGEKITYKDMPNYYNMADVFMFASYHEIASMAIIEASSIGLPLVMRDLNEFKELYKDKYLPCKDDTDFYRIIKLLYQDKKLYNRGVRKSEYIKKHYSFDRISEQLLRYYKSIL